jgi:BirA family biotin operon repressor/biotin-[acetyl-CoA-carboxylase] ligase
MQEGSLSVESIQAGLNTSVIGRRVICLSSTTSTMDEARREAEAGAPEGTVLVAEEQTGGRGRFQREWVSPAGANLLLSVLLRPSLSQLPRLNMAATLAVVRAIRGVTGLSPRVKWPNDVLLGGRKTCGILIESRLEGDGVAYAAIGIGLNVNFDPGVHPELAATATSLMREMGAPVSRLETLRRLLRELDALYAALRRGGSLHQEWRGLLETLGSQVRVRWGDQSEEGVAVDVDDDGSLVLERVDGSRVALPAGEVSLSE